MFGNCHTHKNQKHLQEFLFHIFTDFLKNYSREFENWAKRQRNQVQVSKLIIPKDKLIFSTLAKKWAELREICILLQEGNTCSKSTTKSSD